MLSCTRQEICLCDPPVVMALVDGPTGENDNMICVAYKHQFDLINESTGDAYRLHHVDANRVRHTCNMQTLKSRVVFLFLCIHHKDFHSKNLAHSSCQPQIGNRRSYNSVCNDLYSIC